MNTKLIEGYLAYTSSEEYAGAAADAPGTVPTTTSISHTVWPTTSVVSVVSIETMA